MVRRHRTRPLERRQNHECDRAAPLRVGRALQIGRKHKRGSADLGGAGVAKRACRRSGIRPRSRRPGVGQRRAYPRKEGARGGVQHLGDAYAASLRRPGVGCLPGATADALGTGVLASEQLRTSRQIGPVAFRESDRATPPAPRRAAWLDLAQRPSVANRTTGATDLEPRRP
jgi:hypothetical protein